MLKQEAKEAFLFLKHEFGDTNKNEWNKLGRRLSIVFSDKESLLNVEDRYELRELFLTLWDENTDNTFEQ